MHRIIIPRDSANDESAVLTRLHVTDSTQVQVGQLIAEIELTKTAMDIHAPVAGVIYLAPSLHVDAVLRVGAILAVIATDGVPPDPAVFRQEMPSAPAADATPRTSDGPRFSKAAAALVDRHGLDRSLFANLELVRAEDVETYLERTPATGMEADAGVERTLLFGAGGHAKVCVDLLRRIPGPPVAGAVEFGWRAGSTVAGIPVLGDDSDDTLRRLHDQGFTAAVVAVGSLDRRSRRIEILDRLLAIGFSVPPLIHPDASVDPSAEIGVGVQVMAGAVVSADARLGDICIINSNAVVSHDCVLGRNVHMAPGAVLAGRVVVGESSTVGMAATVYLGLRIGSNVVVQNGCHIFRDLADGEVAKAK